VVGLNLTPTLDISLSSGPTVYVGNSVTLTANPASGNAPYSYLWSGDCAGTLQTASVPSTIGTHSCTALVTDADGDTASAFAAITVIEAPAIVVEEVTETPTPTPEEEVETGDVLGITCDEENKRLISGYIYDDKNEDGVQNADEDGLEGVTVIIKVLIDGSYEVVTKVTTNEDGYYEALVCPGEYKASIDESTLSDGAKILGDNDQKIEIDADDQQLNFNIEEKSGFNWWICIVPLLILSSIMGVVYVKQRNV